MKHRVFYALLVALIGVPTSSSWVNGSLCTQHERVVFACTAKQGDVFVCEEGTKLHYRFGKPGHIKMSYPTRDDTASPAFHADTVVHTSSVHTYITFIRKNLHYTVFDATEGIGPNAGPTRPIGVVVTKGDKNIANLICREGASSEFGPDLFQRDHLQPETPPYELEIPEAFFHYPSSSSWPIFER